jgi:hypothetical protein
MGNARSGFTPLLVFLDRPDIAAGEALAAKLRPGNAGSNTTADHIEVLVRRWRRCRSPTVPDPATPTARGC